MKLVFGVLFCLVGMSWAENRQEFGTLGNSTEDCTLCKEIVKVIQEIEEGQDFEDVLEAVAKDICLAGHGGFGWNCIGDWACNDLCSGIVKTMAPPITYIIGQLILDPTEVCEALNVCPKSMEEDFGVPMVDRVRLEKEAEIGTVSNGSIMRIAHITDVHWDTEYFVGGNSNCGEPLCCRKSQGKAPNASSVCGYWGDPNGDTSIQILESLLEFATTLNVDAVFETGDGPAHNIWNQTEVQNTDVNLNLTRLFNKYFGNKVFRALGNHDGFPVDLYHVNTTMDADWLYNPIANLFSELGWLDEAALETFRYAGYYSIQMPMFPRGRVIVVPDNLQFSANWYTLLNSSTNIANMTSALESSLRQAQEKNEFVYILGHHPPNDGGYHEWLAGPFTTLLQQYKSVIRGSFWGHTHTPQIQNHLDTDGTPIITAYIGASPTTNGNHNPTFRVYDIDTATGEIVDYTDYRLPLSNQWHNASSTPKPQWIPAYSVKSHFNLTSLSPASWFQFADRMRTDDDAFKAWEMAYSLGNPAIADFSQSERLERVCDIQSGTAAQNKACKNAGL